MKIEDLKPNEKNPRKISDQSRKELEKSAEEFGDLSGIIYNVRTKRLAGGHQRISISDMAGSVKKRNLKEPSRTGTVAEGFVEIKGERFSYREVDWSIEKERLAMIAANKHGGEWDHDILKINFADIDPRDLELTGFDPKELEAMDIKIDIPEIRVDTDPNIVGLKAKPEKEETDEQYVANTPQTTEQIPTMNPNENVKVDKKDFDEVKEDAKIVDKRFVIVVDCPDQGTKDDLRKKLLPMIEEAKCKIF